MMIPLQNTYFCQFRLAFETSEPAANRLNSTAYKSSVLQRHLCGRAELLWKSGHFLLLAVYGFSNLN